ncbi:MAG: GNAT family N-acetyltransferase [Phycisphaerales bacterium]|nr:GNAT family N-acetyltransferase [Phycisphaerales bacterium]
MENQNTHEGDVRLRPVEAEDDPFLLKVYASTRAAELSQTGWDAAQKETFVRMQFNAQRQHYQSRFPDAEHSVILKGNQTVGRLYVSDSAEELRVLDITVLPEHRSAGIGGAILRDLLASARKAGKPVRIHVEADSRCTGLFNRLGFTVAQEKELHVLLEWVPRGE